MTDTTSRRKLAAILSADVVGYSRLMSADEDATLSALMERRALMGSLIRGSGGRVVDAPGDALLAEFPSAVDAVQCAVEIQRRCEGLNAPLAESRRMRLRIGLNLGDVIERDGALYGDGVNIAARLEALASPGGICVSAAIHEHVIGKVSTEFVDAGPQTVKNIDRPVRAFHVRTADDRSPQHDKPAPAGREARAQLAKLSRPRVFQAVARPRLFAKIDQHADKPCLWVSGPPGSGKTTLVATWLEHQALSDHWCQIDAGDRDPATFFDYLSALASPLLRQDSRPLPVLGPDSQGDLPGFSRLFFRQLFQVLPQTARLVLDNHHAGACATLDDLLRHAIEEVPAGLQIIVISRYDVAPALARPLANGAVGRLTWDDLKLTEEETGDLVMARASPAPHDVEQLHALSGGWAAGVVLISAGAGMPAPDAVLEPAETVFAYFASEVLDSLAPPDRDLLLCTACFPQFTAEMAREVCDHPAPSEVLDQLYRRQYFTERRGGAQPRYRYHDLFRSFLEQTARTTLGPDGWRAMQAKAADALESQGELDAAMTLLRNAGHHDALGSRVLACAGQLLSAGRWQALLDWVSALPAQVVNRNPDLLRWKGLARMGQDPVAGRALLEHAYQGYSEIGDLNGQTRTAADIINSFYHEWNMISTLDRWIEIMEELLQRRGDLSREVREAALTCMVQALYNRRPSHPSLAAFADEVELSLHTSEDVNSRLTKAWNLMYYFDQTGQFERSEAVFEAIRDEVEAEAGLAVNQHLCWHRRGYHHYFTGDFDQGRTAIAHAIRIAESTASSAHLFPALLCRAMLSIADGRLADAALDRDALRRALSLSRHVHTQGYMWIDLWLALEQGTLEEALRIWDTFSKLPTSGIPVYALYNHAVVWLFVQTGRAQLALDRIAVWHRNLGDLDNDWAAFNLLLMEASAQWHNGQLDEARSTLAAALALGARHQYRNSLTWVSPMIAELLALALDWGIEHDYVVALIRARRLRPPREDLLAWPREIEIRCLGTFEIRAHGAPVTFGKKAPRKTLSLLKAIVSHGHRGLTVAQALADLWPDLDGDAAADALAASLYRLRKLVGHPDALLQTEGFLRLNTTRVWVDAIAFEDLRSREDPEQRQQALKLYAGPFLPHDADEPWTVATRERMRSRFVSLALETGSALRTGTAVEEALTLYRACISVEPAAEALYVALMEGCIDAGRHAQARQIYGELERVLRREMGLAPSPRALAVAERALLDGGA